VNLRAHLDSLRDLDPDTLPEAELRPTLTRLVALLEEVLTWANSLAESNEELKAEVRRLKGQSPRPKFPPSKPESPMILPPKTGKDHSSEKERREPKVRRKRKKRSDLRIDSTVQLTCDPTTLPPDAEFKGYEERLVQELVIESRNVLYRREKYYSPSLRRTFLAPFPEPLARHLGGAGSQFGPGVKAFTQFLHYGANVGQKGVLRILRSFGVDISAGQVCAFLTRDLEAFHAEHAELEEAGLGATPWAHLDATSTKVNGVAHVCHVLTHPLFTSFRTTRCHDRAAVVDILRGGAARRYRLDSVALEIMAATRVSEGVRRKLGEFFSATDYDEAAFRRLLEQHLPQLANMTRCRVETAALIASYRADPNWPALKCLLCDDAAVFQWITGELALCWVHDARHYQKLNPQFVSHQWRLERFRKQYWTYYRKLLAYRQAPTAEDAERLRQEFVKMFAQRTGYACLDTCIARTEANSEKLLLVLKHPELPLHNNPAELAARQRVRRRDVSFGPRTEAGRKAWDTFQSLLATTDQMGIRFWDYLYDRITRAKQVPRLGQVIAMKASEQGLHQCWEQPLPAAS